jgi:PemK-like, MazF-like toxin of type II toxin-antitoxin system
MAANGLRVQLSRIFDRFRSAGAAGTRPTGTRSTGSAGTGSAGTGRPTAGRPSAASTTGGYAGDFTGKATLGYAPKDDGLPDPGEVVWAWVPFEEDHSQGKDRPVLVIARKGSALLGLMLTSKDHDRDHDQEARHGRYWVDIGTGAWDRQGRPSEVRLDRILRLDPAAVRREGGALDRATYDVVAAAVRRANGW